MNLLRKGVASPSDTAIARAAPAIQLGQQGGAGAARTTAKPLRAIQLRRGGRCGCSQCLADERRDQERRDALLLTTIYDLGVEQLRLANPGAGAGVPRRVAGRVVTRNG